MHAVSVRYRTLEIAPPALPIVATYEVRRVLAVVDIPPEGPELFARSADQLRAGFSEIGDAGASTASRGSHPLMHRTETVDYGIVIDGETMLVLDAEEVYLQAGSVVIQRGINHAWANRSDTVGGPVCH